MNVFLWMLVAIGFVAAIVFMGWLWTTKNPRIGELGDRLNLMINASMFVLTVLSITIAIAAFHDAKTSGDEQKKALDSSRDSLRDVVSVLNTQVALLNDAQDTLRSQLNVSRQQQQAMTATNIALLRTNRTLKSQLRIATAQNDRELDRLNKWALVVFRFQDLPEEAFQLEAGGVPVKIKDPNDLTLTITNIGTAPILNPVLTISASPASISVSTDEAFYPNPRRRNTIQFYSGTGLEPVSVADRGYAYHFKIAVPPDVTSGELVFRLFGSNMTKVTASAFVVVEQNVPK
ncbi:MAG TPA: hypothetical protein VF532_03135 [Candidatus Angelobacter sp.]